MKILRNKLSAAVVLSILVLLAKETRSSSMGNRKLIELEAKLRQIQKPFSSSLQVAAATKQEGRVVYPIGYGADPTGVQDSSDAIMNALNDAFGIQKGIQMLAGVNDLGGVVIDLQGGNYKITKPLRFPSSGGANLLLKGGTIRASDTFPGDAYLIELWSENSQRLSITDQTLKFHSFTDQKDQTVGIYYEDITFRDILFDSSFKGGGIFIIDSARIRIHNCFFLHFATQAILVQRGHETFISSCFLGQHSTVGGDKGEKDFTGTAIDLASNDNAITDVAIFSAEIGVLLRGQANILTGVHCYNKATYWGGIGILVKLYASLTRIDNCYLDYNSIVMEDPVQVHVSNGLFLGDGNVVLTAVSGKISGVNIVNNMFNGNPNNMVPIVAVKGSFTTVDQVVIDQNNVNGMGLKSTAGRLSVGGNGTKWVADFSSVLVFPNKINHFQYSFYSKDEMGSRGLFPVLQVTNVSNNVVVVESDKVVNGVVSVIVDQYNIIGEGNVFM